jgi:hypothetical protein
MTSVFWGFFLFFVFAVLGFELRAYTLRHSTSLFVYVMGFFKVGSCELFAQLALNHDPPDLCLLSSWDYRYAQSCPASDNSFFLLLGARGAKAPRGKQA